MNIDHAHTGREAAEADLSSLPRAVNAALEPPSYARVVGPLLLVNLLLLFMRPQYSITPLQKIYIVLLMSLVPLPFWLPRWRQSWTSQTKAMAALLIFGAIRGPFARNNYWAFHTFRDVAQGFVCFMFPIVVFLSYGSSLRKIGNICTLIGMYLALYAVLHKGFGPGAFLGDENDNCLAIVMCTAFPLFLFQSSRSFFAKAYYLFAGTLMLAGVVATGSRGGFLGLAATGLYFFLTSRQKGALIAVGLVCAVGGLAFVPSEYWTEIKSIKQVNEGTAMQRRIMWKRAFRIFLDPKYMLHGVGMENTRYHIEDYESAEDFTEAQRSFAGRQVHSMYLQLLADMGLIGVAIFLSAVGSSFLANRRIQRRISRELRRLPNLADRARQKAEELEPLAFSPDADSETQRTYRRLKIAPAVIRDELLFQQTFTQAVTGSLVGVLVAGAFISVLYYPVMWFVVTLSATAQICSQRLFAALEPYYFSSAVESQTP